MHELLDTPEVRDTPQQRKGIANQLLTRRTALRGLAVGVAGVAGLAATASGGAALAAPATVSDTLTTNPPTAKAPHSPLAQPRTPQDAATWTSAAGLSFLPDAIATRVYAGGGAISLSALGEAKAHVDLPNGASILAMDWAYVRNDTNPMNFSLRSYDGQRSSTNVIAGTASNTPSASVAFDYFPAVAPILVAPAAASLYLTWAPGTASGAHLLVAGYIRYINNNGLVLFPSPKRCFGDGTTYAADAIIPNIDASVVIPSKGGGPTGLPTGASVIAAFCAVQSYEPGVMTLYAAGSPDPGLGNWAAQAPLAATGIQMLYMMVPLNGSTQFTIHNNFTAKRIFVDVWGYLI